MSPRRGGRGRRGGRSGPGSPRGAGPRGGPRLGAHQLAGQEPPPPAQAPAPDRTTADVADLEEEARRYERDMENGGAAPSMASPQAVAAFTSFLRSLGIEPRKDPEFTVTAQLTADFLAERTAALREEPRPLRPSRYRGRPGETVRLERIPVYGMCPHHLVPYFGSVSVRYVPSDRICGIGAIAKLVRELSCAPRLQENLTQAIADCIERDLEPASVEVTIRARHLCLEMRGVEQRALFVTEAKRGGPAPASPQPPTRR